MNQKTALSLFGAAVLASLPAAGQAAELLLNGSFESPATNPSSGPGNNPGLGITPDSWTITGGQSNLVYGSAYGNDANGNSSSTITLGADPYLSRGQQSLDISATGTAVQTFTPSLDAPATVKFDIGRRDLTASNGSTWTLTYTNALGNVITVATSGAALNPTSGWLTQTSSSINLFAGTRYTFTVNLDNADQLDGVSIAQVPEPTTLTAAGLGVGLLGWMGFKRRRRA